MVVGKPTGKASEVEASAARNGLNFECPVQSFQRAHNASHSRKIMRLGLD